MNGYKEKDVKGWIVDLAAVDKKEVFKSCEVTVRMTNDGIGQSLSLSAFNIQIGIPLEQVREILKVVE